MNMGGPQQPTSLDGKGSKPHFFPWWLLAMSAVGLLILLILGFLFHSAQKQNLRSKAEDDLAAVARLKVAQIAQWRFERLADAGVVTESPYTADEVIHWLSNRRLDLSGNILSHFRSLQKQYHYYDVLLVDVAGKVIMRLTGESGQMLHEESLRFLVESYRQRQPLMSEIHIGPGDIPPHVDVIAPLFAGQAGDGVPVGAVVLQSDASQFLFPMIESWPSESLSAETLLVRQDGDRVLFLNELRHHKDTALKLYIPLSRTEVPAVMAVLGRDGIFQGLDYRGVDVLAAVRSVPDSPWHVVAKIDAAEVFKTWHSISLLIILLTLTIMAAPVAVVAFVWQRMSKIHYRELYQANAERLENQEKLRAAMREVRVRNAIAQVFLTVADDEMYDRILVIIMETMESKFGVFGYLDEQGNFVAPTMKGMCWDKCRMPDKSCFFPLDTWRDSDRSWPRALREKRTIWSNEPSKGTPHGHIAITRHISLPLIHQQKVIGIIQVANKDEDYSAADVALLETLGQAIAPVLDARLRTLWTEHSRRQAEEEVRRLNAELEKRVADRTSELREAQEKLLRQERLAAVGQLAGGIGHELRKPLTVIANAVFYLRLIQPEAEEKVQEYLGILENEVFFAEKIISDLLDFSRVKSVDRATVNPAELVSGTLERYPAPENITVKLAVPDDLPAVCVDRYQMVQVLGNLVVNGCQSMTDGGTLTVSARREQDMVVFTVTDTGPGIAAENMDRLFEPLFTTKARGIGLGLAVCRKLVETNNGMIGARNETGGGATFIVHLPIYQEET